MRRNGKRKKKEKKYNTRTQIIKGDIFVGKGNSWERREKEIRERAINKANRRKKKTLTRKRKINT